MARRSTCERAGGSLLVIGSLDAVSADQLRVLLSTATVPGLMAMVSAARLSRSWDTQNRGSYDRASTGK